jgi:hypothetical protein
MQPGRGRVAGRLAQEPSRTAVVAMAAPCSNVPDALAGSSRVRTVPTGGRKSWTFQLFISFR